MSTEVVRTYKLEIQAPAEVMAVLEKSEAVKVFDALREARGISAAVRLLFPAAQVQITSELRKAICVTKVLRG